MKFTARNRKYEVDSNGVVIQTDHHPFSYDPNYSAIYDKPEYKQGSDLLQALRLGFAIGAHKKPIQTLMDVGYGNAAFINFVKQHIPFVYGYDITGVPLDGAYVMPELVKANVYTFHDVLEHFPDLTFIKDLPAETIVCSMPYCHFLTQGLDWFENKYHHLKPDEHIRHFNPYSLSQTMYHLGWVTVGESDHENIIRKGQNGLQNIFSMAFKRAWSKGNGML